MKITDFYINGFGIFHDLSVSNMDHPLVLLHGNNEAGKSTLLGFIRAVLFGFPRVNAKDAQYVPLAGGRHGGLIGVQSADGSVYTLSRKPGARGGQIEVTGPNGTTRDKGMLSQLLGGVSYEAFRNIYAFGLSELQSFESLKGESIAGAIYGAGLGDAMLALPQAKKKIRDQLDRFFKPGGSKPVMNQLVTELDRVDKALKEAAEQTSQYDATWDVLQQVEKEVAATQHALSSHRRNRHRYGAMVRLWPEWVSLREREVALFETAPVPSGFPDDGLDRLNVLVEKRERLKESTAEISGRIEKLHVQLSGLTVNETLLDQASNIALLLERRNEYSNGIQKRPVLEQKIKVETATIQQTLHALGLDWTEDRICGVDQSLFTREAIRKHRASRQDIQKDLSAADILFADKEVALEMANRALAQAEKALVALGRPPARREPSLILQVKQGRDRFADAIFKAGRLSGALHQSKQELYLSFSEAEASARGFGGFLIKMAMSNWLLPLLVLGGVAATGMTYFFQKGWEEAAIAGGGAMVTVFAAWGYQRYRIRINRYREEKISRQQEKTDELEYQLAREQTVVSSYGSIAATALEKLENDIPSGQALLSKVDQLIAVLPEEDRQREIYRRAQEFVVQKREDNNAAQQDMKSAASSREQFQHRTVQEENTWQAWLFEQGLPGTLSSETAMEAIDSIHRATAAIYRRNQFAEEFEWLEKSIGSYRLLFEQTLSALKMPIPKEALLTQVVEELISRLEKARGDVREKRTLEKQAQTLAWENSEADNKVKSNNQAIHALLEEAGMNDEGLFEKTAKAARDRNNLLAVISQCRKNIFGILGETDSESLRTELTSLTLTDVKMNEDEAVGSIQALEGELTMLLSKRADLQQKIEMLSASDDILRLRSEEAQLTAALEDKANEWAQWALTEYLVDTVTASYEKKHQPHIIQDAGNFFSQMTGGRYTGLLAPIGDNTILAVNDKGEQVLPQALSRGTAEQLYLAVRFGYIRHRAKTGEALPVVMDDILVNFDPVRARHAAEAIQTLSESHQVLYFTCHPETVALFKEMDTDLPVYTLKDGTIGRLDN
jgi:uncharacterized protein YhaN